MSLRTVTFWTTLLLLLATIAAPFAYLYDEEPLNSIETVIGFVVSGAIIWVVTGSPLVVSLMIIKNLKYTFPAFIMLASTIAYGFWFGFIYAQEFSSSGASDFWMIPAIGIGSIFWMLPTWYIAWKINSLFMKNAKTKGNSNDH